MNSEIAFTAEQAVAVLKENGVNLSPDSIRRQAHENSKIMGFPVCVMKSRVLIPKKPFLVYWGIEECE